MARSAIPNCGICGSIKEHNGRKLVCRSCNKARVLAWQKANPDRANAKNRKYKSANRERVAAMVRKSKIRIAYGMPPEEYERILASQGGTCAICLKPESRRHRDGTVWALSVDHDHETGVIRGLLCGKCNTGIANFGDDPRLLAAAICYLKKERGQRD